MTTFLSILPPLFLLLLFPFPASAKTLNYKISGILRCLKVDPDGNKYYQPFFGQKVEFWEQDSPDGDDYFGEAITDLGGLFSVTGHENEDENEPYLWIRHKCNSECTIKTSIDLDHFKEDQSVTIYLDGINDWAQAEDGTPLPVKMHKC